MKFENTKVMNFEGAFRGLRNPLESWSKSDSFFGMINIQYDTYQIDKVITKWVEQELKKMPLEGPCEDYQLDQRYYNLWDKYFDWFYNTGLLEKGEDLIDVACIGPEDMNLAQRMIKAGTSDRKFLRQIMVSVDITAPLYWWKEMDQYKIGTVTNSTSTMHKLASTPITKDCFEMDDFNEGIMVYEQDPYNPDMCMDDFWNMLINDLEHIRQKYRETKDKRYWKELIRLLPESWLQTRTITLNYEILRNIYFQRQHHRLTEWHTFCDWIKTLPYSYELIYGI